jgi:hypothetical protein
VQYVAGAYASAEKLATAQAEGRRLMGLVPAVPHDNGGRYTTEAFEIQVEQRQAACPANKVNSQRRRLEARASGQVIYRFERSTRCAPCPLLERCTGPEQKHRTLVVGEHDSALQSRRGEQKTESSVQVMKHHNRTEGNAERVGAGARA